MNTVHGLLTGERPDDNGATAPDAGRATVNPAANFAAIRRPNYRPANFLAHLIAVKQEHPQTRERRRAEPAEAIRAYLGVMSEKL